MGSSQKRGKKGVKKPPKEKIHKEPRGTKGHKTPIKKKGKTQGFNWHKKKWKTANNAEKKGKSSSRG